MLFISTSGSHKHEVTVKGNFFKVDQELRSKLNDCKKPIQKPSVKIPNGKSCTKKSPFAQRVDPEEAQIIPPITVNDVIKPTEPIIETPTKPEEVKEPKKTFSFNPNAPEFRPRSNILFSDNINGHVLFSPHTQQFPPVFSPNSAPAIFVPNIFFYAPNQPTLNGPENSCTFDNATNTTSSSHNNGSHGNTDVNPEATPAKPVDVDEQHHFGWKPIAEMHLGQAPAIPFPQMMPLFPPLPIFVPNHHSFKFNALPFGKAVDMEIENGPLPTPITEIKSANVDDAKPAVESATAAVTESDELSNPLNWPPLPLPVSQQLNQQPNQQGDNQK